MQKVMPSKSEERLPPPESGWKILAETVVLIGCIGIVALFFITYALWLFTSAPLNPVG